MRPMSSVVDNKVVSRVTVVPVRATRVARTNHKEVHKISPKLAIKTASVVDRSVVKSHKRAVKAARSQAANKAARTKVA